eukprot:4357588-Prymnesium_polylepis.1
MHTAIDASGIVRRRRRAASQLWRRRRLASPWCWCRGRVTCGICLFVCAPGGGVGRYARPAVPLAR